MTRKCVVWDLDDTVWDGVCLEGDVSLRPVAKQVIEELDGRGILHSIASRGVHSAATAVLEKFDLARFFVASRINWQPKPTNLMAIADELRISRDAIVFVDDDSFELDQMRWMLPEVKSVAAHLVPELPSMPDLSPIGLTEEGRSRRAYYQTEANRRQHATQSSSRREFLESCQMRLCIRPMRQADVPRVIELMSRTHQLNTTGITFSQRELLEHDPGAVRIARLSDRFGDYGTIGAAVCHRTATEWRLGFMAVSCRVLGRGVERGFLVSLLRQAAGLGFKAVVVAYRETDRNQAMKALCQMCGLKRSRPKKPSAEWLFHLPAGPLPTCPPWLTVECT